MLQNETNGWLRPKEIAKLAENFEECCRSKKAFTKDKSFAKPPNRGSYEKPKETRWAASGSTGRNEERTNLPRYFNWGVVGHFQRECTQARRQRDQSQKDRERPEQDKVVANVALFPEQEVEPYEIHENHVREAGAGLRWVKLLIADQPLTACLDSGLEITVLRSDVVPASCLEQSCGKLKLKGAFGQMVSADLVYVPLSLSEEGRQCQPAGSVIVCGDEGAVKCP